MAKYSLQDADIFVSGYYLSDDANAVNWSQSWAELDTTNFDSGGAVERIAGLETGTMSVQGFWDTTALKTDFLYDLASGVSGLILTAAATGAAGGPCLFGRGFEMSHTKGGTAGEVAKADAEFVTANPEGTVNGELLMPRTTGIAATSSTSALQLTDVDADETLYAALHVFSTGTGTIDVTIESDDNSGMTSPTTQATFTQKSTALVGQAEWQSAAGAITDDWWRVAYTVAGAAPSFAIAVCWGVK